MTKNFAVHGTFTDGKHIIVIKRHDGRYAFIGGKVENNETLLDTFTREFKEESNLNIKPYLKNTSYATINVTKSDLNYKFIIFKVPTDILYQIINNITFTREITDIKLIKVTEITNFLNKHGVDIALQQIKKFLSNPKFDKVIV